LKKPFYLSILILIFSGIANAQICGQLFQYGSELPLAEVYWKNSDQKVESDFDGNFRLPISIKTKSSDLIFNLGEMILEINNVEMNSGTLDLGRIMLPEFRSLKIQEYEELTASEKEECKAIYHWTKLIGYYDTNNLERNFLLLICKEKVTEFNYNPTTKTVSIEWNKIKHCE